MAKSQDLMEPRVIEVESVIQECRERIREALELEGNQLKEKAERDSSQIIARAKEEADKSIAEAREAARLEAERVVAAAREEAEQMTKESREESARMITETRKKVLQMITETMRNSMAEAQAEITRASSEARSKTSQLLAQAGQSVEQIIGESEQRINAELEGLTTVIEDTAAKLPQPREMPTRESEAKLRAATAEEPDPPTPVSEKPVLPIHKAVEGAGTANKDNEDLKLYEGSLTLEIVSPFGQEHQGGILERLVQINGLKVRSTEGFTKANRWITKYNIFLKQPTALMKILKPLPGIKEITEHKDNIIITLK
jgi:F0F1-type ATP synthase membrane subunit b/b'